jgi:hypothetical protein
VLYESEKMMDISMKKFYEIGEHENLAECLYKAQQSTMSFGIFLFQTLAFQGKIDDSKISELECKILDIEEDLKFLNLAIMDMKDPAE